jgi:asparagine synthase (glutamine-hydrolysing)
LFDEPFAVTSALAIYVMARETVKHVKVILTGDGGDEVFAGYPFRHTRPDALLDKISRLPLSNLRNFNSKPPQPAINWRLPTWLRRARLAAAALVTPDAAIRPWRYLQTLYTFNEAEKFALYTPEWAEYARQTTNFSSTDDFLLDSLPQAAPNRLARWLYFDLHTTLADEMLSKVDKASMAWGLEARTPFLDYRLVEYALTLPMRLLAEEDNGKKVLKKLGERYAPKEVLYRPKHGFNVPFGAWLRQGVPPILADGLSTSRLNGQKIFCDKPIKQIIQRHQRDAEIDLSNQIVNLAWLGLWQANG